MSTCEEIAPVLAAHADDALETPQREQVAAHVDRCPGCAGEVAIQRVVRHAIRAEVDALRGTAPAASRNRVTALVSRPVVVPFVIPAAKPTPEVPRWRWSRFVPASLAAGLALTFGVGALSPAGSVLAAQLALDHLKCRMIATVSAGADPAGLGRQWERDHGWPVTVPGSSPDLGLQFVGLRNCLHHEGTMAHLMYDYEGHRLSLFVMPHTATGERDADVFGQQTHTWATGGRSYALVTEGAVGDLHDVAAYLRHAVR